MLAVLLVSACAVLSGARSFVVIAEYAHDTGAVDGRSGGVSLWVRQAAASPGSGSRTAGRL
ncbi:hypothetical protein [Pseudonocardia sp. ICBG162]|uniref:hypothetical protein n=1 Tax=Pseudonocardia sp. ICBG162 TaxID=2846761 RepID=UPI0035AECDCB